MSKSLIPARKIRLLLLPLACFFIGLSANTAQIDDRLTEGEMQTDGAFIEAEKFRLTGFCDKAIPLYQQVLKKRPRETAAMFAMARCYQDEGDSESALRWLRQAVEYDPQNPWYRQFLIRLLDAREDYAAAARQAGELLRLQPDDPDNYYQKAYYLARSGEYDKALKTLDQLQNRIGLTYELLERKYLLLIDRQELKKAEKSLREFLAQHPNDIPAHYLLADLYRKMNKRDKAAGVYKDILRLSPNDTAAAAALSEIQSPSATGQNDAVQTLSALFKRQDLSYDDKMKAFIPLVQKAFGSEDPQLMEETTTLARQLLNQYPEEASAHAALADLLYGADQLEEARKEYAEAIRLKAGIHSVWFNYLDVLQRLGDYATLASEAEKAIDFFPNEWQFYYLEARAQLALNRPREAADWLREALPLSGKDTQKRAFTLAQLTLACEMQNKKACSDQNLQQLQELTGESPILLQTKACIAALRGEHLAKALEWARTALNQAPENPDFLLTYARLLSLNGRETEAQSYLQKAREMGGGWCPVGK